MPLTPRAALSKDRTTGAPKMQHRHFAHIAQTIAKMDGQGWNPQVRQHVAWLFADELARTNPHFNRMRFLQACEPESPVL